MSKNDDDLFGGMFDINGDGKTDFIEKYLEYNYLEESAKNLEGKDSEESDFDFSSGSHPSYHHRSTSPHKAIETVQPEQRPLPETINRAQYDSRTHNFISDCISAILAFILCSSLPCIIMGIVIAAYDPQNSVSGTATFVTILIGVFFIIVFLVGTIQSIKESYLQMNKTKELYELYERQTGKK